MSQSPDGGEEANFFQEWEESPRRRQWSVVSRKQLSYLVDKFYTQYN
jgi:hypothetical protein